MTESGSAPAVAPPASGHVSSSGVARARPLEKMQLRVLSYNIHKCIGGVDRRYDPDRILEVIRHHEPDVVLLQEVAQHGRRWNHDVQVERLGDALGFRHRTYFVNVRWKTKGEYGNAILSRFPITNTENIDLTQPGRKRRSVLHARLRVRLRSRHTRTLHVFNLHLGLGQHERGAQLQQFLASQPFAGLDARTPILVAGDFNDLWGTLGRRHLLPAGFRAHASAPRTFPAVAPLRPLDAVFVHGQMDLLKLQTSRLELARAASDHLPLIADLEITPA